MVFCSRQIFVVSACQPLFEFRLLLHQMFTCCHPFSPATNGRDRHDLAVNHRLQAERKAFIILDNNIIVNAFMLKRLHYLLLMKIDDHPLVQRSPHEVTITDVTTCVRSFLEARAACSLLPFTEKPATVA